MRALVLGLACALAACASGPQRGDFPRIPLTANPSKVVTAELGFARMAKDEGQWTAFRRTMADGALIFGRTGAIPARDFLRGMEDPPVAVDWEPYRVWSSCDGSLAVTNGALTTPEGESGEFVAMWRRQSDGEYRWVFDAGWQTDAPPQEPAFIQTEVADCDAPPAAKLGGSGNSISSDATLTYDFELRGEAGARERTISVTLLRGGAPVTVYDRIIPSGAE
ncbi:hypothetical protein [Erythrobacter litoralis]|uniref:DUF4440 domain-containing protein n=1 Tax=Erythrobacter litoralis (strain HTCC2594) TaxID=314225 RepID=Q2N7E4_ERYLH|nr:hypothetical protein [Erythrobacter litoralis]ABC64397.1 hypothetical protein ELI_11525 [Erythrobacter litoralis HTCC2594]